MLMSINCHRGTGRAALAALLVMCSSALSGAQIPAPATRLTYVGATAQGRDVTVTLRGNGALRATSVEIARDLPPRIVLDFAGLAIAPALAPVAPVGSGDVRRVRVAYHSVSPRVTRVVIDLTRPASFDLPDLGVDSDELQVVFGSAAMAVIPAVARATPSARPTLPVEAATPSRSAAPRAPPALVANPHAEAPRGTFITASDGLTRTITPPPSNPAASPVEPMAPAPGGGAVALPAGAQVKVEGHRRPDGSFDAVQVVLRNVDGSVKVEGRIDAVRPNRAGLTVLGFDIVYGRDLTLYHGSSPGASRAELVPGTWVEVKGTPRGDTLVAQRIRIKDAPESTEELEGVIATADAGSGQIVVLGRAVRIPAGARVIDERRADDVDTSRLRRDDDDQARQPYRVGSRVLIGGRLESSWTQALNYDLEPARDRSDQWASRLQVLASAELTSSIEAYAKLAVNRSAAYAGGSQLTERDIRVQEAYLIAHRIAGSPVSLQVGRQRFRDPREWFFDEYLDAVRVSADLGGWSAEAAVADGVLAGDVATRSRRDKRQYVGEVTRRFGGVGTASVFVLQRDDTGPLDDDPRWLGGISEFKHASGSRLWALGAARHGHRGTTTLGGWAFDTGATVVWADGTATPSFTLGYAHASGDAAGGDGRDNEFRQTNLEDNSARLGGLRRLAYYGELFDPELSNLRVWTAGVGFRPARTVGLDVVLHRYLQAVLDDTLRSDAFDRDATERSPLLGHELDAALTFRVGRVDVDLTAGAFLAGPGIGTGRRLAFFWRPYVRVYF